MKFFLLLTVIFSSLLICSFSQAEQKKQVVTLSSRNTLVLRNIVDEDSVSKLSQKAIKLSHGLSTDEDIYLVMDTPGGDINAGHSLITTLKGLPQKVTTITQFAASMGFITVQSLDKRLILPDGILMSHRARGGTSGQVPGELNTRVKFFTELLDKEDAAISKRVGMSKSEYQKLIINEYWVSGSDAVSAHMADGESLIRCDKELSEGTEDEVIQTFFGPVKVTYSKCPLVKGPLAVSFDGLTVNNWTEEGTIKLNSIRKIILELLYNKRDFYHDFYITNAYKEVLP